MNRVLLLAVLVLLASCANRVTPTGGLKDTTPPKFIQAIPADGTTSFREKSVRFVFDELVQVGDVASQLVVSPPTTQKPVLRVNRNEIVMRLPDSLSQNTTYSFDFGKLISDVHESNPLLGFRYAFSTGESLDSLVLSGTVSDAWTKAAVKEVAMFLYKKPDTLAFADSILLARRCDFFARTDDSGRFVFRNLPSGSFFLFACADKNGNFRFDDPTNEAFGFLDAPVQIPSVDSLSVFVSLQKPADWRILRAARADRHTAVIAFNRADQEVDFKGLNGTTDNPVAAVYSAFRDTLYLYTGADSLKVRFTQKGVPSDTVLIRMIAPPGAREPEFKLRPQVIGSPAFTGPDEPLRLTFGHPLARIDSAFRVVVDTLPPVAVVPVLTDSVKGEIRLEMAWKEGKAYRLEASPGTLRDVFGNTNDTIRLSLTVPASENTALLTVRTVGVSRSGAGLLQLVDEKGNERRSVSVTADTAVTFRYLTPGSLRIRFIVDRDGDGRWTAGDWKNRIQPEPVVFHPDLIQLRPNWENEVLFQVAAP